MRNIAFFCIDCGLSQQSNQNDLKLGCKIKFTINVFYCLRLQSSL